MIIHLQSAKQTNQLHDLSSMPSHLLIFAYMILIIIRLIECI